MLKTCKLTKSTIYHFMMLSGFIIGLCYIYYNYSDHNSIVIFDLHNLQSLQLLTAHFMHYDARHLIMNIIALTLLLYLCPTTIKPLLLSFTLAIVLIDLYLITTKVEFYAGLSGLLYAICGLYARKSIDKKNWTTSIFIVGSVCIYIAFISPMNLPDDVTWQPLPQAHILGFIAGLVIKTKFSCK